MNNGGSQQESTAPLGGTDFIESNWEEVAETFDVMGLKEDLLRGIYAFGFEKPSAIQQRAIVPCCTGTKHLSFKIW